MNKYGLFLKPGSNTFCFLKQQKENYKKINKRQNFVNDQHALYFMESSTTTKRSLKFNQIVISVYQF